MSTRGKIPTAVEYADYLASLTPEQITQEQSLFPVQFRDQMHTAERESVLALMHAFVEKQSRAILSPAEDWLTLGLLDTFLKWSTGAARTCIHMPNIDHPAPVLAAAWKLGLVTCLKCAHLFQLVGDADRTCDCCGEIDADGVHPIGTTYGCMTYYAGACSNCSPISEQERP